MSNSQGSARVACFGSVTGNKNPSARLRWLLLLYGCIQLYMSTVYCSLSSPEFIAAQVGQDATATWTYSPPEGSQSLLLITVAKGTSQQVLQHFAESGTTLPAQEYGGRVEVVVTDTQVDCTLKNFTTADEGPYKGVFTYTAVAGHESIVENSNTVIAVPVPPDPVLTISGYTTGVSAGQSLPLTCTSTQGKPPAQVTWWKGDVEQQQAVYSSTPNSSTYQGDAMSVLTLAVQPANNQETYQCRVSQLGTEKGRHELQLHVRFMTGTPTLTGHTNPVTSGSSLTLTCTSGNSNPPATITWTRVGGGSAPSGTDQPQTDGQHGGKITSQQIRLTNLQAQDNGAQFKCTATNSQLGQNPSLDSSTVSIDVRFYLEGSSITGYPGPVTSDSSLTLTCTSGNSNPPATITWTRVGGGAAPTGTDQPQTDGQHGGKITSQQISLTNLQAQDNGAQFKCTVTNSAVSQSEEKTVTIDVQYAPTNVQVTCEPSDLSDLREGGGLVCTCTAVSNPAAQYSWIKDSTAGSLPTGAVVDSTTGTLTFSTLDRTHSGEYQCTATNSFGSATSGDINVDVKYPASITFITPPVTVDEYDDVSLTCTADGNPAPNLSWSYMDGTGLTGTIDDGSSSTTTITAITYQQAGMYACTAGNGIGTVASAGTNVTVEYRPKFHPSTGPYPAAVGADVSMECSAFAVPNEITFSWSKDETTLTNSGRLTIQSSGETSVLSISGVVQGDYGTYNCTATNGKGSSSTTRTLQPLGPPDAPTNLKVVTKNPEGDVTFQWTAGFNGGLNTTHTVDYRKQGDTVWTSGATKIQPVSENHINYNVSLQLGRQGNFIIRLITSNDNGTVPAVTVDVLIEDETVLEGKLTVDQDFHADYNNLDSQRSQDFINEVVTGLDETVRQANLPGYQSSRVVNLSPGSVVADFETTVAKSEVQRAISAFDDQVKSGSLRSLSVVEGTLEEKTSVGGGNTTVIIIAAVVCVVVLSAVIGVGVFVFRRRKSDTKKPAENHTNIIELNRTRGETNDGYQSLRIPHRRTSDHTYQGLMARSQNETAHDGTYEDVKTPSEFPRNQLDIKEELGHGEFGSVYKAEAWKISGSSGTTVLAAKELKGMTSPTASTAFFKELSVLKLLGTHPNVVSFLGCCTDAEPFYLLLEYVSGGSLQSNLRTSRTQQTYGNLHGGSKSLSSRDLTKFAWDVAKGMTFLSSKKIIHRDLASRNVLVSTDRTCKVSDFGFSREGDEYERTTKTRLPIRWMAPESLFHRKYTTKTDVWAFGVLLWEIVTLGATPYPGMSKREVMDGVQQGYRMDKPKHCDAKLYNLMQSCWVVDPARRPEFRKIQRTLDSLMETEHDYINLATLDENTYTSLQTASDEKY